MKIDVASVRKCLKSFDFNTLFREHLGWDNYHVQLDIPIDVCSISLTAVAQKRGFVTFFCDSIPDRPTRLKIDHQVTKSVREHLVIYADRAAGRQVWQWVRREPGKPLASRDHYFDVNRSGDRLIHRLEQIAVSLDEEENITIVDVAGRARSAFDVDKVTKKFYDRFKTEHAAFLKLIKGIRADADLHWYTSLMLNRLMFVYFIQKKGFLDGDTNYLRNRLQMVRESKGKDKFQSFYRYFLLRLFHDGLGKSPEERKLEADLEKLLGKVPFLNGGFFEVHQIEERNTGIDIPDEAFEKLFDFFDRYSWHLDERPLRADNEINPDVVGYIFEKYINQKQMGAYYTKEDITEYISKNTIIPFLFDAAEKKCPIAFKKEGFLWRLLCSDPDRYIYSATRYGVIDQEGNVIPLPEEIEFGVKDVSRRGGWNKPATDPYALPTETWREHVARRQRCLELRQKLQAGEVQAINDLITLNLDIWQFSRDAIVTSEGPELLRAFWQAIEKITVLDPTCGSGAFLFAALRILETLYSDCLERMERFVEDLAGKPHHPEQFSDFKKVLAQIARHPNDRYFILKSIIINNLFGVDIMEEAVEICKLRLFLKLVAQVETVEQIEPLPDIDFNIRCGNTLIGYATQKQASKAFKQEASGQLRLMLGDSEDVYRRFEEDVEMVDRAFHVFRDQQTTYGGKITPKDKQELRRRLEKLDHEIDRYLAGEYGITANSYKTKKAYEETFAKWKASHQPFHWFVEFYGIMHGGGFDVIIGNPPYVDYSKIKSIYGVHKTDYSTLECGNLYALVTERAIHLTEERYGFILPLSSTNANGNSSLQELFRRSQCLHISHYAVRPSKLFNGVDMNLTIILSAQRGMKSHCTTSFNRWQSAFRECLFSTLQYEIHDISVKKCAFPKFGNYLEPLVWKKLNAVKTHINIYTAEGQSRSIAFHGFGRYWRKCILEKLSDNYQEFSVPLRLAPFVICLLNSQLAYWYWIMSSDCYRFTKTDALNLTVPSGAKEQEFKKLSDDLMKSYEANSVVQQKVARNGKVTAEKQFFPALSKPIIDEIDRVLARHYGFTEEELDFIINYDIKYRMGRESGDDEE